MDDLVLNVRQIGSYPQLTPGPADAILFQQGGLGGPYAWTSPGALVAPAIAALVTTAQINITGVGPISWGQGQFLQGNNGGFGFNALGTPGLLLSILPTGDATLTGILSVGRDPLTPFEVSTKNYVDTTVATAKQLLTDNSVWTVNGKQGNVNLTWADLISMGGAPINSPAFQGTPTAPSISNLDQYDWQIPNTAFVQDVVNCRINALLHAQPFVWSFNGRIGNVCLTVDDVNAALTAPGAIPLTTNPPLGDASTRIATTLFVDASVEDLRQWTEDQLVGGPGGPWAPLNSPNFTGVPTAPTAGVGSSTGQLATTAFVHAAVTAATTGVASFNTRTGAVVLTTADITGAGGATLASPIFTGTPQAPTAAPGNSSTQLATTAFVQAQLAAGVVSSFNTRTGAVTLSLADVTGVGGAPLAAPAFTGIPTAATASPGTNTTQLATTAFVMAAVTAIGTGVISFEGRTGAVNLLANDLSAAGGALLAGPAFTGVPTAPTASVGTNTTQLATTAFVAAAIAAGGGVSSFNTRTGTVTLTAADISAANGALLASPIFTGIPLAPQAAVGTATNQVATCSFVQAQIAAGITSFNGRTGAVTLLTADITGAGGAPISSPNFSGVPLAPTAAAATSNTQIASTAFVQAAITAGSVASFNGRTGAITLIANDVSAAGGALLAGPAFTGIPTAPTAAPSTNTTQLATTAYVMAALAAGGGVTSFNGRAGVVTLSAADITGAGGALLAGPTFTGIPAAPTPAQTVNTTQLATTAYVTTKVGGYLPLAGGGLTGSLSMVTPTSGDSAFFLDAPTSGFASIYFQKATGSYSRWLIRGTDLTGESGGNVGSNLRIVGFSDTGTILGDAVNIRRADGMMMVGYATGANYFTGNAAIQVRNASTITMGMAVQNFPPNSWGMYFYNSSGAGIGGINLNESGVSYQTSSDARLKEDITAFTDGRDLIDKLQVRRFRWRHTGKAEIGIIAQEAIAHYPDAVAPGEGQPGEDNFRPMAIDYSKYVPLLIEAVQDLNRHVGELEKRIKTNGRRA
jgi:hypothetical protein